MRVVGAFWNGFTPADGPLMSDLDNDGIYTVTVPVIGMQGNNFGGYKFWTNSTGLPPAWNGFYGSNRTANLGAGGVPQTVPVDWFRHDNLDGTGNYYQWADAYGLDLGSSECEPTSGSGFRFEHQPR